MSMYLILSGLYLKTLRKFSQAWQAPTYTKICLATTAFFGLWAAWSVTGIALSIMHVIAATTICSAFAAYGLECVWSGRNILHDIAQLRQSVTALFEAEHPNRVAASLMLLKTYTIDALAARFHFMKRLITSASHPVFRNINNNENYLTRYGLPLPFITIGAYLALHSAIFGTLDIALHSLWTLSLASTALYFYEVSNNREKLADDIAALRDCSEPLEIFNFLRQASHSRYHAAQDFIRQTVDWLADTAELPNEEVQALRELLPQGANSLYGGLGFLFAHFYNEEHGDNEDHDNEDHDNANRGNANRGNEDHGNANPSALVFSSHSHSDDSLSTAPQSPRSRSNSY